MEPPPPPAHYEPARKAAPYGKACQECSRSKCKCMVLEQGEGKCSRCQRAGLPCHPAQPKRKRNSNRLPSSKHSETRALEKRVDELFLLVRGQHDHHGPHHPPHPHREDPTHASPASNLSHVYPSDRSSAVTTASPAVTASESSPWSSTSTDIEMQYLDRLMPPPGIAEECLAHYRNLKMRYFPFVCIPADTTPIQLREQRPFLYLCIMAVSTTSITHQRLMSQAIRKIGAREMVISSEKSLDLLQGMLVVIAWFQYQTDGNAKSSFSTYLQLAISMVFDMGLNRPPGSRKQPLCIGNHQGGPPPPERTLEERRAVLGTFVLSSILAAFLQKTDALRWTTHMSESLQVIADKREYRTDLILVQQVRLQLLAEQISLPTAYDEGMGTRITHVPSAGYAYALHDKLEQIRHDSSFHVSSQHDGVIGAYYYNTELMINEMMLPQEDSAGDIGLDQIKYLWACLRSIKNWFDVFLAIPLSEYHGITFSLTSQLVRCLTMLYRLTTLKDPAWDSREVRAVVDVVGVLDRVAENMARIPQIAFLDNPEGDVFTKTSRLFRSLVPAWAASIRGQAEGERRSPPDLPVAGAADISVDDFMDLNWLDDDWQNCFPTMPSY